MQCYIGFCTPTRTQMELKKKKGFKHSASSSAFAELHCPCPCHPRCHLNDGCEVLNDSCGQEAIASTQSQSVSQSPTTSRICHLHFLDFSPCPREPLDLMTFFFLITNITKLRSGELSSVSRSYGKSPTFPRFVPSEGENLRAFAYVQKNRTAQTAQTDITDLGMSIS